MKLRLTRPAVVIGIALGAVVVLGLVAILIGSLSQSSASRPITGPVSGVRDAQFSLLDGATSVRVQAGAIGDDLYRISTPADAGLRPRVTRDGGDVRLRLEPNGRGSSGVVDIVLNAGVDWDLRMIGGAREMRIDMTGGKALAVHIAGGASLIDVALGRVAGLVPVSMAGGVDQFRVRVPAATPVRVTASSGAGSVTIGGQTHEGVAGGQVFTAGAWRDDGPGVDVRAQAGAGAVLVSEG